MTTSFSSNQPPRIVLANMLKGTALGLVSLVIFGAAFRTGYRGRYTGRSVTLTTR
jgi:hypothetical protein